MAAPDLANIDWMSNTLWLAAAAAAVAGPSVNVR
jgi:hypothetical protein